MLHALADFPNRYAAGGDFRILIVDELADTTHIAGATMNDIYHIDIKRISSPFGQ